MAGLLGMLPDDERIPDSFSLAQQAGLDYTIGTVVLRGAHPNTALLRLEGVSGRKLEVMGASIGGGRISICQIDGITTNFGGDHNTLIVHNQDTPRPCGRSDHRIGAAGHQHCHHAAVPFHRRGAMP